MDQDKAPAQRPRGRDDHNPPIWVNLAETNSEYSQYRCSFEIKRTDGLRPGRYIAWLKWNDDWKKWSGALRADEREAWDKRQQESKTPPAPPSPTRDDIPF